MSIETIKVTFVLSSINNLDVCAAIISMIFLNGETRENIYVNTVNNFGKNTGKIMLIDKVLYGLVSSAARFHDWDLIRRSQYRSLTGCANWLVTLGRFDIANAIDTFSWFSMQPREVHTQDVIRLIEYIRKYYKEKILIDSNYPENTNDLMP